MIGPPAMPVIAFLTGCFSSQATDLFDMYNVKIYFCWYLLSYTADVYRLYELTGMNMHVLIIPFLGLHYRFVQTVYRMINEASSPSFVISLCLFHKGCHGLDPQMSLTFFVKVQLTSLLLISPRPANESNFLRESPTHLPPLDLAWTLDKQNEGRAVW